MRIGLKHSASLVVVCGAILIAAFQNCSRMEGLSASPQSASLASQSGFIGGKYLATSGPQGLELVSTYTTTGNCPRYTGPYIGGACTHEDRWLPYNQPYEPIFELKVPVKKGDVLRIGGSITQTNDANGDAYLTQARTKVCAARLEALGLIGDGIPWSHQERYISNGGAYRDHMFDVSWKTASMTPAENPNGLREPTSGHINDIYMLEVQAACFKYAKELNASGLMYPPNLYMQSLASAPPLGRRGHGAESAALRSHAFETLGTLDRERRTDRQRRISAARLQ